MGDADKEREEKLKLARKKLNKFRQKKVTTSGDAGDAKDYSTERLMPSNKLNGSTTSLESVEIGGEENTLGSGPVPAQKANTGVVSAGLPPPPPSSALPPQAYTAAPRGRVYDPEVLKPDISQGELEKPATEGNTNDGGSFLGGWMGRIIGRTPSSPSAPSIHPDHHTSVEAHTVGVPRNNATDGQDQSPLSITPQSTSPVHAPPKSPYAYTQSPSVSHPTPTLQSGAYSTSDNLHKINELQAALEVARLETKQEHDARMAVEQRVTILTAQINGALERMVKEKQSLVEKLASAEQERDAAIQETERLKVDKEGTSSSNAQLQEREEGVLVLEEEIRARLKEVERWSNEVSEREREFSREKERVENMLRQVEEAKAAVETERIELERLRDLGGMKATEGGDGSPHDEMLAEIQRAGEELEDEKRAVEEMRQRAENLLVQHERFKVDMEKERHAIHEERATLMEEQAQLQAAKVAVATQYQQIEEARQAVEDEQQNLYEARRRLEADTAALEARESVSANITGHQDQPGSLELEAERAALGARESELQKQFDALNERASSIDRSAREVSEAQRLLEADKRSLEAQRTQLSEREDKFRKISEEFLARQEQSNIEADQVARDRVAAETLRRQVEMERAKLSVERAAVEAAEAKVAADRAALADREGKLQRWAEEIGHKQSSVNEERRRLEDQRNRIEESRKVVETERRTLDADRAAFAEREVKYRELMDELLAKQATVREEGIRVEQLRIQYEKDRSQLEQDRRLLLEREGQLRQRTQELLAGQDAATEEAQRAADLRRQCDIDRAQLETERTALLEREAKHKQAVEEFLKQRQAANEAAARTSEKQRQLEIDRVTLSEREALANRALEDHAAKQRELDGAIRTFNEFKAQLDSAMQQREASLQDEKRELEAERAAIKQHAAKERAEMEAQMRVERAKLEESLRMVEADRAAVSKREETVRKSMEDIDKKKVVLAEELGKIDVERSRVAVLRAQVEQERVETEAKLRTITAKEAELARALSNAPGSLKSLGGESPERVKTLETQIAQLSLERDTLRERLSTALTTHEAAARQMSLHGTDVQSLRDRIAELERENRSFQSNVLRLTDMLENERRKDIGGVGIGKGPSILTSPVPSVHTHVDDRVHALELELARLRTAVGQNGHPLGNAEQQGLANDNRGSDVVKPSIQAWTGPDKLLSEAGAGEREGKTTHDLLNVIVALTSTNQSLSNKLEELGSQHRPPGTLPMPVPSPIPPSSMAPQARTPRIPDVRPQQDQHSRYYDGYDRPPFPEAGGSFYGAAGRDTHQADYPRRPTSPYVGKGRQEEGYATDYDYETGRGLRRGRPVVPAPVYSNGDRKVSVASVRSEYKDADGSRGQATRKVGGVSVPDAAGNSSRRESEAHRGSRGPSTTRPGPYQTTRRMSITSDRSDAASHTSTYSTATAAAAAAAARTAALRAKLEAARARVGGESTAAPNLTSASVPAPVPLPEAVRPPQPTRYRNPPQGAPRSSSADRDKDREERPRRPSGRHPPSEATTGMQLYFSNEDLAGFSETTKRILFGEGEGGSSRSGHGSTRGA
ncbi:uncharacterized protein SPPG_01666 [Spizellomyces punctatus DAOM BR117]|uniref:Uncharacterized protein n=1 Tax=Spizellomyces punctatus (strain DAOM BR117) TaxID=645134 RepID=A0A0L0HTK7_SPIPD|nr:uncharacterized protein SPPG_01666 [Spizellomyces punctatus DAOM BR117]KND04235.1 hypothetical protein SPPG_01666 [Spizellomyces punctatus DAOM BR117]|eukprot:XP_016612274.1 hypothetical protein SPPG_01666 [Spizellomyces punctatus DAOM BR117]